MELIYLANGQACYLKEKLGEKYIVNKIYEQEHYYGEDSEMVEFVDETDIVVDAIFKTPPIPKFSEEVTQLIKTKKELQNSISSLTLEKSKLSREVEILTKTKISNNSFILNKTELINAKKLALFPKDRVMPKVLSNREKRFSGLKVSMEVKISSYEERYWGYALTYDGGYSYGDFLCPKYGILIDPTDEEIEETIKKRLIEIEFSESEIASVDDKYLTPSQIGVKNSYITNKKLKEKEKLQKQLIEIQDNLKRANEALSKLELEPNKQDPITNK